MTRLAEIPEQTVFDALAALEALVAAADDRAAATVEALCDWTADFKGTRTVIDPDHEHWHLGYPCPYDAMAAVLRGHPDPRRQEPTDG